MRANDRSQSVYDLLNGKRTCQEISEATGLSMSRVYTIVKKAGRSADLKFVYRNCAPSEVKHLVTLRADVNAWVRRQTPKGAIPADVLIAIIEDAFLDEQEAAK